MKPLRTDGSNPFAHQSMAVRVPGIAREIQALNPDYPQPVQDALTRLRGELENDEPIAPLGLPAPDYEDWQALWEAHSGQTWLNSEWFFVELFFYRRVIEATRWWETGRDPFAPKKAEEYAGESIWRLLAQALESDGPPEERLSRLLGFALWGNRVDLSYALAASHGGEAAHADDLLVDDRPAILEKLLNRKGTIHIVCDNAGTELAMDFALVDALLELDNVVMHLKMHPTFVSDATVPDVLWLLGKLESGTQGTASVRLARRLREANEDGRLRFAPDLFWNSAHFISDLPPRLVRLFQDARLVISKGDANYRRLVSDTLWPHTLHPSEVLASFPAPLMALRTLKCDVVLGLPDGMAERLDAVDPLWRVNGKRGIIQLMRP
jgi:uncharacterized protein with ATP-grasp and redox domains